MKHVISFIFLLFAINSPVYSVSLKDFFYACKAGDTEIIELGLSEGISPNQIDEKGFTPLCYAARQGDENLVNLLLENGASLSVKTTFPPLHLAAYNNHFSIVKILLHEMDDLYQIDSYGETAFENALENCNFEICDFMIENGFDVNYEKPEGNNIFSAMLQNGDSPLEVFVYLIKNHFDIFLPDKYYGSILLHAYESDRYDIVELLVNNNADVNYYTNKHETILMFAIEDNNTDLVEMLLKKNADLNVCNIYGETPLSLAIDKKNEYLLNLLLDYEVDCSISLIDACKSGSIRLVEKVIENKNNIDETSAYGCTGLMETKNSEIASLLISKGADVNLRDDDGNTALMNAAADQNYELVNLLIECGANVNYVNSVGDSALLNACYSFRKEVDSRIINLLLQHGANPKVYSNRHGTCIWAAVLTKAPIEVIELLIFYGAPVGVINDSNPLTVAIEYENYELVKILLEAGANARYVDSEGENLLFAVRSFHDEKKVTGIVNELVKYGIDVNQQNNNGYTALHIASNLCNYEFARLLLSVGANPNSQNKYGDTPLSLAIRYVDTMRIIASVQDKEITNEDYESCVNYLNLLLESGADPTLKNLRGGSVWSELSQIDNSMIKDCFIKNCFVNEQLSYRKACTEQYSGSEIFSAKVKILSINKAIDDYPKRITYTVMGQLFDGNIIILKVYNSIDFIINDTINCFVRYIECNENQMPCFEYIKLIGIE